jgi:hypothetical protein
MKREKKIFVACLLSSLIASSFLSLMSRFVNSLNAYDIGYTSHVINVFDESQGEYKFLLVSFDFLFNSMLKLTLYDANGPLDFVCNITS